MKAAALQMVSTPSIEHNLRTAGRLIAEAADAGATLVALPEYFCLMGRADGDKLAHAEAPGDGPIQAALADAARRHGVWLIGGTLPLRADTLPTGAPSPERVFNACCVYTPNGEQAARYDKIHLFQFDNGEESYDEGRVLQAGSTPVAFDMTGSSSSSSAAGSEPWRVGLSVCYDLRFSELYRRLATPPCDVIAVPSAFTYTTGQAHWELLLRTRAVENQCYVIAPAQGGRHDNGRRTWGHSLIADPWGEVLAVRSEGEGVVLAELQTERLAQVRAQLPALRHRRL